MNNPIPPSLRIMSNTQSRIASLTNTVVLNGVGRWPLTAANIAKLGRVETAQYLVGDLDRGDCVTVNYDADVHGSCDACCADGSVHLVSRDALVKLIDTVPAVAPLQSVVSSSTSTSSGIAATAFALMDLDELAAQSRLVTSRIDQGVSEMRDHWDDLGAILVRARVLFPSTKNRAEWIAAAGLDRYSKDERAKAAWWHLNRAEIEASGKITERLANPVVIYQTFSGIRSLSSSTSTSSTVTPRTGRPSASTQTLRCGADGIHRPATAEILQRSPSGGCTVRGKSGEIHEGVKWSSISEPLRNAYNEKVAAHNARIHAEYVAANPRPAPSPRPHLDIESGEVVDVEATEIPETTVDPEVLANAENALRDLVGTSDLEAVLVALLTKVRAAA
ncbi:hypothetical protein WKW80_09290 [Variovorax humicola]|uniref:Uncharacterized protein n=1 Tax=Variovorax humicola TaxID=1769758 RepID=A0ABU8VYN0_9BURK